MGQTTILKFDKTFNCCEIHVTVSGFKELAVVHRDTGDHPLFFGPIMLHGNSDYDTYRLFMQHIAAQLESAPSLPIIGK